MGSAPDPVNVRDWQRTRAAIPLSPERGRTAIVFAIIVAFISIPMSQSQAADTLSVGTGLAFARIADALAKAHDGDVIAVGPGTYPDTGLIVSKRVAVEGHGWPVLDARGGGTLIDIRADGAKVAGLVLRGVGTNYMKEVGGVWITGASDVIVAGNRFEKDFFGVYGAQARRARIEGNSFTGLGGRESSNGNGVHFWKSDSVRVIGNSIRGHRDGIYLEFTGHSEVRDDTCEDNVRYGLHFMYSHGNRYLGNLFRRNGSGVAVMYSREVDMRGNRFEENWGAASYGLLLKSISGSRIEGNRFVRNTVAVFQEGSSRIEMRDNLFRSNGWALRIVADCDANRFEGNRFEGNTFDVAYNASPENSNVFSGNAWDKYQGWDLDRDGIGDVPHRPVELFPTLMQEHPQAMILLRSHFVTLLNVLERMFPTLSPASLQDERPLMPSALRHRIQPGSPERPLAPGGAS
jgi:nitrous oxidase accessory protein